MFANPVVPWPPSLAKARSCGHDTAAMASNEPPKAAEVQAVIEKRLQAQAAGSGLQETVTIEWRGKLEPIPVITMPVELLTYNPDTHRIRAQRTHDPSRNEALRTDPFGADAQGYLHKLLMGDPAHPDKVDPAFEALREDLKAHSQSDPGIVTRSGILINGNTRRAALKELGAPNIRVGVLPGDASFDDRQSIELSLQLRRDHRRDYSFMNLLLAIDARVDDNVPAAKIQIDFRMRPSTYERNVWILEAVRECITRSEVTTAGGVKLSLRLIDFEEHQGKLEELYRAYMTLKAKSPEDATLLREQRLLAITMNKSKTDVRLIEPDFADKYMSKVVPAPTDAEPVPNKIPGLSIAVAGPSPKVRSLKALTDEVLKARVLEGRAEDVTPAEVAEAGQKLTKVREALDKALDQAGRSARLTKKRLAAADRIADATEDINLALHAVVDALQTSNFDAEDIDEPLRELNAALRKLSKAATRDADGDAGDGVAWLKAVGAVGAAG